MTMVYTWNVNYCEYLFTSADQSTAKLSVLHWDCEAHDDAYSGYTPVRSIGTQGVSDKDITGSVDDLSGTAQVTLVDILLDAMGPEKQAQIEAGLDEQWKEVVKPSGGGFQPPQDDDPTDPI